MLNAIIRFSLKQQLLVIAVACLLLVLGTWQVLHLEIDVFPNLNRPRVVVMTEAPGMAPEEVETLITFPLETALNGASGVQAVRSSSGFGLSVIYVEFDWGTDIYTDRQIVAERLAIAQNRLPPGIQPQLAPISSIMGQILMIGLWSETGQTSPLKLRTLADWEIRQRLLTIPGVSQVFVIGGGRKQYQVLVDPDRLRQFGVTLNEVKHALERSNRNATGGYLDERGAYEYLVRGLGRVQSLEDLKKLVVKFRQGRSVTLAMVADVVEGPQVKRGDSSAFARNPDGSFSGGPAVVLTINKQPDADTRLTTERILEALEELKLSLPDDVHIEPELYSQRAFIDRAIENVVEALRDGGVLVVVILFLFLLNLRTTFITLTAIPLSILMTALVFAGFGLSINTMTLGGLAIAIGELVDDAIVDVENIFRRLRENRLAGNKLNPLLVVFRASSEIRNSIVFGTLIVVLVFVPLFALSGMEGRLFSPLGVAYIVSLLCSLVVSLTVTPVLSYWLLRNARILGAEREGLVLRVLRGVAGWTIAQSIRFSRTVLVAAVLAVGVAVVFLAGLERDFLPPFNEGSAQLNVVLPPGTSLKKSEEIAVQVEERLKQIDGIAGFVRRTGRAELDEHAMPVSVSEFILSFDPNSDRSREEMLEEIRETMKEIPGIVTSVEQPLAHLISHMLSGVKAQIGIKVYGDDLEILRRQADAVADAVRDVPGVKDLIVEPQVIIPQLRVEVDRDRLELYGLLPEDITEYVETAMNGVVVSEVLEGQRTFDLLLRLPEEFREDREALKRLPVQLPTGGTVPLSAVARIYESGGPNTINREKVRRRIVIQCNVAGRGLVDVVEEIQSRVAPIHAAMPSGYFMEFGGQFESEQAASRLIAGLSLVSLLAIFLLLYSMFRSANFALQVMAALPMAFIGSVAALVLTHQTLTVAAMVGFVSLGGIASRNGILLLNHYLYLVRYEGESFSPKMIVRAGRERVAPVLMTALTSGIGLVPLAMAAGEPGKEILYPVATVIIGGLITSTLLEFVVRPALFWRFGCRAGERIIATTGVMEVPLTERHEEPPETSPSRETAAMQPAAG